MKSPRRKKQHSRWAAANAPEAKARAAIKRDAARMALPAPCYEAYRPGDDVLTIQMSGRGWCHVITLDVPPNAGRNRTRSDLHAVTVDGQRWPAPAGLVAVFAYIRKLVPRRLSRAELSQL